MFLMTCDRKPSVREKNVIVVGSGGLFRSTMCSVEHPSDLANVKKIHTSCFAVLRAQNGLG